MERWTDDKLYLGEKTKKGTRNLLKPSEQLMRQTLAIQVRLPGPQKTSAENNPVNRQLETFIKECIATPTRRGQAHRTGMHTRSCIF